MGKQNNVYTYNDIIFNFKEEVVAHATTWINLENIMLSGISQSQKE